MNSLVVYFEKAMYGLMYFQSLRLKVSVFGSCLPFCGLLEANWDYPVSGIFLKFSASLRCALGRLTKV